MKNVIIVISLIINLVLATILVNDRTGFLDRERLLTDYSEEELREMLGGKSNVFEMTAEEWTISNHIALLKNKEFGVDIDTLSYEAAKYMVRFNQERERLSELRETYCTKEALVFKFHEMMDFNYPNARYKKSDIKIQTMDQCRIQIALTTSEKPYNWKTFYIFEVSLDEEEENYKMEKIKGDFIG
jgi:hypothetical protein